jgi:predicted peptidase
MKSVDKMNMILLPLFVAVGILTGCASNQTAAEKHISARFELVNEVFGYGQDTTTVVIDAGETVLGSSLDTASFTVSARNSLPDGVPTSPTAPQVAYDGPRKVIGVYVSNDGETFARAEQGRYIVLELTHGREVVEMNFGDFSMKLAQDANGASTLSYYMDPESFSGTNVLLDLNYTVTQAKPFSLADGSLVTEAALSQSTLTRPGEVKAGEINPLVNRYTPGRYESPETGGYLEYSVYSPASGPAATIPLVVWLHGAGEGRNGYGVQNQNVLRGNEEATAWVKPENQAARKAYVLVPQSPDFGWTANNGNVMVKAVIDQLLATHPDIDPNRIYVLGDSMGGFGTFDILTRFPDFFAAAAFCPGGIDVNDPDATITVAHLAAIGKTPLWCVSVEGDTVMPGFQQKMFDGLQAGGANVRWTNYPSTEVVEVYGTAHWAWVPLLSNLPMTDDQYQYNGTAYSGMYTEDSPGQTIMDWLFVQKK